MNNHELKYSNITHKIIGAAMNVHSHIGFGFQEIIYQRALAIEFDKKSLNFSREHEMPIHYEDQEIGTRRADFLVEDRVMVEIKAISKLDNTHLAQAINYLETYKIEIGLLINFGSKSLEFKRLICSKSAKSTKSA